MTSRLLKLNRIISWGFVLFSVIIVVSGYGITRPFVDRLSPLWFFIRDNHVWLGIFFALQFFFHVFVVEFYIRFQWVSVFKTNWRKKGNWFILVKFMQKITGYALFILSLLIMLTGFSFHLSILDQFFPLFQHVKLDLYLLIVLIFHVALGAKMVFYRKRVSNLSTDMLLLIAATLATIAIFYIDMLS